MGRAGGEGGKQFRRIEYDPLPSQRLFHESSARFKGFSGPIGSGKSQALCQEAIKLSYLNPGRLGLIGAPTYPMLRDATQPALIEILERNRLPYEFNKAEKTILMRDTRSRIVLRSLDHFERLRGSNLAWFGVDELTYTHEEAWLRLEGRLRDPKATRLCGFAVWTPKGRDWVFRRFFQQGSDNYQVIVAKPFENRHLLAQVPDYYERLKRSYDERFYQQEVLGEYVAMNEGLVYHAFDRRVNVRKLSVRESEPLLWAVDFNVEPMCSVIAQMAGDEVHVLDEIVLRRASTSDACREFDRRYGRHAAGVVVYGDASGNRRQTTGMSDFGIIRAFFSEQGVRFQLRVPRSNPPVRERVAIVNAKLKCADGTSKLLIDPKCRGLIEDFEELQYKMDGLEIDKARDPMRSHLSDALGYLIWQECAPRPSIGEQGKRLF